MGLGQYDSQGEYCDPHTASSVFLILVLTPFESLYIVFPVRRYEIAVHTGEIDNADTKANVFIIVKGAGGMTGRRALKSEDKNKFEKGKVRAVP